MLPLPRFNFLMTLPLGGIAAALIGDCSRIYSRGCRQTFESRFMGSDHPPSLGLKILELFEDRLLPRLEHFAETLSYAIRRRMEIARALVSEPKLLLLDEPTAGMNPHESAIF